MPWSRQNSSALARLRVAPRTNLTASLFPWTALTSVLAHQPRPTIAARSISSPSIEIPIAARGYQLEHCAPVNIPIIFRRPFVGNEISREDNHELSPGE